MSKKVKTYVLLAVVLGIWGVIGYKIYEALNPNEEAITTTSTAVSFSPKQAIKKDTFSINATHHDPFLNKPYQRNASVKTKKNANTMGTIVFPKVIYKGAISKQRSTNNIYILEINGTQQLFKLKKQIEGITLISAAKKSVVVSFKGQQKKIPIQ